MTLDEYFNGVSGKGILSIKLTLFMAINALIDEWTTIQSLQ